jgi:hypothetical protein
MVDEDFLTVLLRGRPGRPESAIFVSLAGAFRPNSAKYSHPFAAETWN